MAALPCRMILSWKGKLFLVLMAYATLIFPRYPVDILVCYYSCLLKVATSSFFPWFFQFISSYILCFQVFPHIQPLSLHIWLLVFLASFLLLKLHLKLPVKYVYFDVCWYMRFNMSRYEFIISLTFIPACLPYFPFFVDVTSFS